MFRQVLQIVGIVLLIVALTYPTAFADWEQRSPSIAMGDLTARRSHKIAFAGKDKIVLFGGHNSNDLGDTWVYDISDNQWQNLTNIIQGDSPSARRLHGLSYIGDNKVLLYAGYENLNDTWVFDLGQKIWTQLTPSNINGTITGHYWFGMCYLGDDKVLLYSDRSTSYTWVFDLSDNSWTRMGATVVGGTLGDRRYMAMAYIGDDKAVLFSGYYETNDTWVYDLSDNTWTKMSPTGARPVARYNTGMAYLGQDKVVLFSGNGSSNDTWVYDLSDNLWANVTYDSATSPIDRDFPAMTYAGLGRAILFGGRGADSVLLGDTWTYNEPGIGVEGFSTNALSSSIDLTWSLPAATTNTSYRVYKNNKPISDIISSGVINGSMIDFSFSDDTVADGTLNRYQLQEINSTMESSTFTETITVPYCQ